MPKVTLQKIGADVEVFLLDADGEPFPSVQFFPGTKSSPSKIPSVEGFYIQEDNVMPEYNIPPEDGAGAFANNIAWMTSWIKTNSFKKKAGTSICVIPSMIFKPEQLKSEQAQTFGCEPDFCAWTRSVNRLPENRDPLLRTAGGHLHLSYSIDSTSKAEDHPEHIAVAEDLIKLQDLFLGVPSVLIDSDSRRRTLYGKAGAFRPKHYGHEYRVLSNFWTCSKEKSRWAFEQSKIALDAYNNGMRISDRMGKFIQTAINTSNKHMAARIVRTYSLDLV
jgi:hypothetical protein